MVGLSFVNEKGPWPSAVNAATGGDDWKDKVAQLNFGLDAGHSGSAFFNLSKINKTFLTYLQPSSIRGCGMCPSGSSSGDIRAQHSPNVACPSPCSRLPAVLDTSCWTGDGEREKCHFHLSIPTFSRYHLLSLPPTSVDRFGWPSLSPVCPCEPSPGPLGLSDPFPASAAPPPPCAAPPVAVSPPLSRRRAKDAENATAGKKRSAKSWNYVNQCCTKKKQKKKPYAQEVKKLRW